MMDYDLLTIGDISIDIYLKLDQSELIEGGPEHEPKICFVHGAKIPVSKEESNIAGNSINVAVSTTRLGLKTAIYAETGSDEHYLRTVKELKGFGVSTDYIAANPGTETDIHPIVVSGGDRTIFSYHSKRDYKVKNWGNPKWIYYTSIGGSFEEFQNEFIKYLEKNPQIIVAFNPGTSHLKEGFNSFKNVLKSTHILFVNKTEALDLISQQLNKKVGLNTELDYLHMRLQTMGPRLTVITDGKNGASAFDGKTVEQVNVFKVEQVTDMTGAGDSFASAFLAALHHKKTLKEALCWGVCNSASVIQKIGAINGLLDLEQIETLATKVM